LNKTQEKIFEERLIDERNKIHNTEKKFKGITLEAESAIKFLEEKLVNIQDTVTYYKNREVYLLEELEYRNNEMKVLNDKYIKAEKIADRLQSQIDNKFNEFNQNLHTHKEKEFKTNNLISEMKNHIKDKNAETEQIMNEYEVIIFYE